jgi:hypothetical protein
MEQTWNSRDLPVLDAVVSLFDESPGDLLLGEAVVERTGMDRGAVGSALYALSPDYVRLGRKLAEEDSSIDLQVIDGVTAEARRSVGQWPTGESLIKQLIAGLDEAAEQEMDPERRSRLRDVARGLGGAAKSIAIDIARQVLERQIPGAH